MKKMVAILVCMLLVVSVLGASAVVLGKKPDNPGGKPPKEEEKTAEGDEYQITDDPHGLRDDARIFGDKIVWIDIYVPPDDHSFLNLYVLPDGPPTPIFELESSMNFPEIYGNKIVFKSKTLGGDTYLYDLGDDGEYGGGDDKIDVVKENNGGEPDIYEDRIVYVFNGNIWMYDLGPNGEFGGDDDEEYQITDGEDTTDIEPRIFGNIIVWTEVDLTTEEEDWDIVINDLGSDGIPSTDDTKTHLDRPGRQHDPAIYGDIVVWTDERNSKGGGQGKNANPDIYMYDITNAEETRLTSNKKSQYNPDIYGNFIVWQDNRNDNLDVYMYDLGSDEEYRIPTNGADEANQRGPRIFENNIVYYDDRSDLGYDIYMFTLTQ